MSLTMRAMEAVMFKVSRSRHGFERTVEMVRENALRVGWDVPWNFELQEHYREKGFSDMTRVVNVYLCNPQGGYDIMKSDAMDRLTVEAELADHAYSGWLGETKGLADRVGRRIGSMLGLSATIKLVAPKTLQRSEGKAQRVADERTLV